VTLSSRRIDLYHHWNISHIMTLRRIHSADVTLLIFSFSWARAKALALDWLFL
jgi:hypothetical protein